MGTPRRDAALCRARDWATSFSAPENLADFRLDNDDEQGRIYLHDRQTDRDEWVAPAITGRTIETINLRVMQAAADASFVYWITGDEKYARFAAAPSGRTCRASPTSTRPSCRRATRA